MKLTKKLIALLLSLTVLLCCAFPAAAAGNGNANMDEKTNMGDCIIMLQYIAEWDVRDRIDLEAADVSGDGKVNLLDVTLILQWMVTVDVGPLPPRDHVSPQTTTATAK